MGFVVQGSIVMMGIIFCYFFAGETGVVVWIAYITTTTCNPLLNTLLPCAACAASSVLHSQFLEAEEVWDDLDPQSGSGAQICVVASMYRIVTMHKHLVSQSSARSTHKVHFLHYWFNLLSWFHVCLLHTAGPTQYPTVRIALHIQQQCFVQWVTDTDIMITYLLCRLPKWSLRLFAKFCIN